MPVADGMEHTYTPKLQAGWGPRVWREMVREAVAARELTWRLFMREFSARYRQSVLGVAWAFISPLVPVSVFVLLNRSGVFVVGDTGVPYPVFALLGVTLWQVFATGLSVCASALTSSGTMIVKINFPRESLVISAMGQVVFECVIRLVLLAAMMGLYSTRPTWTAIFVPLTMLPLFMLTLGAGFILSIANLVFRDTTNVVTVATTFLMFLTPVLYPRPARGLVSAVMAFNPLTGLVVATRDVLFTGHLTDPQAFIWAAGLSVGCLAVGWRLFHLVEYKMAEVV